MWDVIDNQDATNIVLENHTKDHQGNAILFNKRNNGNITQLHAAQLHAVQLHAVQLHAVQLHAVQLHAVQLHAVQLHS